MGETTNQQTETHAERAVRLFEEGYNCSQSVFGAFAPDYDIPRDLAMRLSASFGAGMGRMREICGCVSGIGFVLGLETGSVEGKDQKQKGYNYEQVRKLVGQFQARYGTIYCKELLGLTRMEDSAMPSQRTAEYYQKRPCKEMIRQTAQMIEDYVTALHAEQAKQAEE